MAITRRTFAAGAAAASAALLGRPALLRAAEPLVLGCVPANAVHWVATVLVEKGLLGRQGFDARIAVIQNSPQSIQQLITGGYQVATSQPEPVVAAVERGAKDLAAISAPMNQADWVLAGAASVKSIADLKGKTIGVSSLRTSESWLTAQLLEKHGLKKGDYSFITAGTSPSKVTALQKGSIGAAILFRPSADLAIQQGLTDLGRYGGLRAYPPVLYAVNKEWAAKDDKGKRVAAAFQEGHRWLWDPKNKDEALGLLGKNTKRERALLEGVYADYFGGSGLYSKTGQISLEGMKNLLADLAEDGEILKGSAPPPSKYVLDPSLGGLVG